MSYEPKVPAFQSSIFFLPLFQTCLFSSIGCKRFFLYHNRAIALLVTFSISTSLFCQKQVNALILITQPCNTYTLSLSLSFSQPKVSVLSQMRVCSVPQVGVCASIIRDHPLLKNLHGLKIRLKIEFSSTCFA